MEYVILKEAVLNNNCPECFAQESLRLVFKQEKTSSIFLVKTKKEVMHIMECKKCETTIYPGQWTEDIERVYKYHRKTIEPQSGILRFTGLSYGLISIVVVVLIAVVGFIYINNPDVFKT